MNSLLPEILSMAREEGWDGEGADAISADTCCAAAAFLTRALRERPDAALPRVGASRRGAVAFQWKRGTRHLILRVLSLEEVEYQSEALRGEHGTERWGSALLRLSRFLEAPEGRLR